MSQRFHWEKEHLLTCFRCANGQVNKSLRQGALLKHIFLHAAAQAKKRSILVELKNKQIGPKTDWQREEGWSKVHWAIRSRITHINYGYLFSPVVLGTDSVGGSNVRQIAQNLNMSGYRRVKIKRKRKRKLNKWVLKLCNGFTAGRHSAGMVWAHLSLQGVGSL